MEESSITKKKFRANLFFPWLTTDLEVTTKRFKGKKPNTLLGMPAGKQEITYPLKNIASVSTSTKFHFKRAVLGLILIFLGISPMSEGFLVSLIVFLFGLHSLLNCYTTTLKITNNAGESPTIEMCILEKDGVKEFSKSMNDTIVRETA